MGKHDPLPFEPLSPQVEGDNNLCVYLNSVAFRVSNESNECGGKTGDLVFEFADLLAVGVKPLQAAYKSRHTSLNLD